MEPHGEKRAVKLKEETRRTLAKEGELAGGSDVAENDFGPVLVWAIQVVPISVTGNEGMTLRVWEVCKNRHL